MPELPDITVYLDALERRCSLHLAQGETALRAHDPGGLKVLDADLEAFRGALLRESHTLKRALTDPRLFKRDWPRTIEELERLRGASA